MTNTKKVAMTTVATLALAACTAATLGMAKGISASAEEAEPVYAAAGWYVVGNGAGSLKDCSWTNYVEEFKLTQVSGTGEYIGGFQINDLALYEGDAFKLLYANGEWQWPNDSGWTDDVVAQYSDITVGADYFVNGGLGNIQVAVEGKYNITLAVRQVGETVTTSVVARRTGDVDPIVLEEMYVVGSLANYKDCNWPGAIDVATSCPKMTFNAETKKWTVELDLEVGDQFKVYNLINNSYYPGGIAGNYVVKEAGTYIVEWESAAPDFVVNPVPAE